MFKWLLIEVYTNKKPWNVTEHNPRLKLYAENDTYCLLCLIMIILFAFYYTFHQF